MAIARDMVGPTYQPPWRCRADLVHGQLHVPEVGFAQVHPGSQKIVPHVGAMHAPAWLFAAVQRQAA
jgi:hypothetical protein